MALIGLAQPGQVLVLASGARGDESAIREQVLTAGPFVLALHGDYGNHLVPLQTLCSGVAHGLSAFAFLDGIGQYFSAVHPDDGVGAVAAGFFPGGNSFLMGFSPGGARMMFFPWVLGGGLPENVGSYLMSNLYSPYLSHQDGLDLCVLLAMVYAEVLRRFGYPDGFNVIRLSAGSEDPIWLDQPHMSASIARNQIRLRALARLMLGVIDR